ncbi:phenylalanine--tRNA ligase subunit alpha [Oenococcus sicerae]|uniref:Phenylalanine--tRNA ligase alpha subunit n=3 Tax=Oenococcus sicerae TaxID=2203724 RepID=A0AAJ1VLM7_9LACO|nr:phenylalanine--tRNA ligase subunit alpha [Oenococcus sicerae]MDN6899648.1 phenylalanine--tRNA ligase subunit alpha [Oenococcus sicerae]QAS70336.1 phenylalanine--tRNA ligase subunit alpha [Oenococcus sicerae]VDK13473.1 Phenylalanine--tRNA ligase alpha subunit {ECO:0000255/HAMAP-Rule:MF_00281} [Oenococcus sicerae]
MDIKEKLDELNKKISAEIDHSTNIDLVENIRVHLLGKKGELTKILKGLKDLTPSEKPVVGQLANQIRTQLEAEIADKKNSLEELKLNAKLATEKIDVTLPGRSFQIGTKHVLQQIQDQIEDHFLSQGFQVMYGHEIETDEYNFERMNLPKDHPARDMQDTFYLTPNTLLRTQTSAMQARAMDQHDFASGPLKMISPGKVYRRDNDDATHSHQFHQIEGLVVGRKITLADLKGTLQALTNELFGRGHAMRFRQSYFPFTEPSLEVDISWNIVDDQTAAEDIEWIEVLGAGMVHPNVLKMAKIDSEKYSGFAFGLGPDRFAMIKYGIDDIRHFYLDDLRFLKQFSQVGE